MSVSTDAWPSAAPRLLLAGDAGVAWQSLAGWVGEAFALPGGTAACDGPAASDEALKATPAARLLYFAGRPEHALRHAGDADTGSALSGWASGVRAVLRVVHAHPGRCLLVDVDDARARPADLLAVVADWLEAAPQPTSPPPATEAADDDVLGQLVSAACVEARPEIANLALEWMASCMPLGEPSTAPVPSADDALAALRRLRLDLSTTAGALQHARVEREAHAARHAEQLARAGSLEQEVRRLEDAVASRDAESVRQRASLDAETAQRRQLESELVLLRAQADQLLEEVDHLGARAEAAEAGSREAQAALVTVRSEAATLSERLASAVADRQQAQRGREQCDADLRASRAELAEALEASAAWQAEREHLMAQLLQAHSDAAAAQALVADPAARGVAGPQPELPLPLAGIALGHVRDLPPHREAHFQLSGLLTPRGEFPRLDVRLVDHEGRPGLVVFGDEARPPFSGWLRHGDEDGHGYMVIVPTDASGPSTLAPLPASDWRFVRRLADLLAIAAEEPEFGLRASWRQVAMRLCMQLDQLPPRLRYDRLNAAAQPDGSWLLAFDGVVWGERALPGIALRWRPGGGKGTAAGQAELAWLLPPDPDAPPPLTRWPETADGDLVPEWPLGVGSGLGGAERRRWWAIHPTGDCALLMAVLDALPAAADAAGQPGWRTRAAALHTQARRTLRTLRLRQWARRLRRR